MSRVFVRENGEHIKFFLHESLSDPDRIGIIRLVEEYGGKAIGTDQGADTVIVDTKYPDADALQDAYFAHPNRDYRHIRVEDITFIRKCIRHRAFQHTPITRYAIRGNGPGRMNYTKADEEHLCRYLAIKIPDARNGGRLGHRIYEDMVNLALVMPREFAWVTRHPAESWREHYRSKKNRERLDAMIERFRHEERPRVEQLYRYDRTLNGVGRMVVVRRAPAEWRAKNTHEEEESGSEEEIQKVVESEDSDDHARPSSLFSVEGYEESEMDVYKPTDTAQPDAVKEPSTSQATLIGPGNGISMSPIRLSRARGPSDRYERMEQAENVANEPEERLGEAPRITPTSRRKRKRAQNVPVPTHEGPFTRSRAGPAGPPAVPDLAELHPRRGRAKQPIGTIRDEEQPEPAIINEPFGVPETITEEENVKRLLTAETNGDETGTSSGFQQHVDDNVSEAAGEGSSRRRRTLETDDEQIERRFSGLGSIASRSGYASSPDPNELLNEFFESTMSEPRSKSPAKLSKAQGGRPSLLPGRGGDEDLWRESSEELFPLRGTRASAAKRAEEKRKIEKYLPPSITRAARYTRRLQS